MNKDENIKFLLKFYNKKELSNIAKDLGEKTGKKCTKKDLANMITNNHNYNLLTSEEIEIKNNNIIKEYYKKIINNIYSKCTSVYNKNYEKPCLISNKISVKDKITQKTHFVYRFVYQFFNNLEYIPNTDKYGQILEVCHGKNCDKLCIEPTHLSLKTKSENNFEDKIRDNTINRGEKSNNNTITEDLAMQIKLSKGEGTQKERANKFKVKVNIVKSIDLCYTWYWLPDKEGNICERSKRKKNIKKEKIFTDKDWDNIEKKLNKKCIESDIIQPTVNSKCLLFQGGLDKDGYGKMSYKCINYRSHILACELKYKKRRDKNLITRHLCNVKNCCNPEHLEFGTFQQNAIDTLNYHSKCKLNEIKVKEIKLLLLKNNMSLNEIAKLYNVKYITISRVKNEKTWSHIKI